MYPGNFKRFENEYKWMDDIEDYFPHYIQIIRYSKTITF